jgi:hypothetical protein
MLTVVSPIIQKWNNQEEQGEYEEGRGKCWELELILSQRTGIL